MKKFSLGLKTRIAFHKKETSAKTNPSSAKALAVPPSAASSSSSSSDFDKQKAAELDALKTFSTHFTLGKRALGSSKSPFVRRRMASSDDENLRFQKIMDDDESETASDDEALENSMIMDGGVLANEDGPKGLKATALTELEGLRALKRKRGLEGLKSSASDAFTNPLKKKRSFAAVPTFPNLSAGKVGRTGANDKASGRNKASALFQFPRAATEKGLAVSSASSSSSGSFNFLGRKKSSMNERADKRLAVSSASSSSSGSFDWQPPTKMSGLVAKDADTFIAGPQGVKVVEVLDSPPSSSRPRTKVTLIADDDDDDEAAWGKQGSSAKFEDAKGEGNTISLLDDDYSAIPLPLPRKRPSQAEIDLFGGGDVWVLTTPVDEVLKIFPNAKRTWVKDKLNGYNCKAPKCDRCVPRLLSEMTENPYGHNPSVFDRWNVLAAC
jgi:hypothetical protein